MTSTLSTSEPIAIVGMDCRLPGGVDGPEQFWGMLCASVDGVCEVPPDRWSANAFFGRGRFRTYSRWGGFLDDIRAFDAGFFGLGASEAEQMDPQQRLLLESAWKALEDAGLALDRSSPSSVGVFVGASTHDYADIQFDTQELCSAGAFTATGGAQSIISNRISYCLNLTGPSFTVDTACSSSLAALHLAVQSLRSGECTSALVGGVNCLITHNNFVAFSSLSALSRDGRCKSFDASGDGFVRAEGVGVVVLKRLSDAIASGDRIYSTVLASGLNQDGRTSAITMPNGDAQKDLVRATWQLAGVDPATICYVEAHGTGTAVGDPVECRALGEVAAEGRAAEAPCLVGSVKSNVGHLESGAGVVGLIKLALVLFHREAPPSLHFNTPNPSIDFQTLKLRVVTQREPLPVLVREADGRPRYLGAVNSFGFGGANAHAVLSSAPPRPSAAMITEAEDAAKHPVLLLSAASEEALRDLARRYRTRLSAQAFDEPRAFVRFCQAAASRRAHLPHRMALVGPHRDAILEGLTAWENGEESPRICASLADDAERPGAVLVYSGQGPQWWGMGRQLWEHEPRFRAVIETCDEHLRDLADWSLVQELLRDESSTRLHETAIAQPAIFAVQAGLTELLRHWGLSPAAVVGHSVGEAAAAWAAGALTLSQGIRLMFHRGRCMAVAHGCGTLLALGITEEEALSEVAAYPETLALAAVNAPCSVALAGARDRLQEILERYEADGVFARFVPVEYPFHSPFMDPAREQLLDSLSDLRPAAPETPLYSTVTAAQITDASLDSAYWWRNVREPVRFAPAIRKMVRDGFRVFLEISAHPALAHSIRECLNTEETTGLAWPTLRRDGQDLANLAIALAQLHCHGVAVEWSAYLGGRGSADAGLPEYPWQRKEYWRESLQSAEFHRYSRPHPFLWRRLTSPDPTWEMVLDSTHHSYLNHHSVSGRAVFPGAGYLEGALAMAEQILPESPTRTLQEVRFLAMLPIGTGKNPPRLHLKLFDQGTRFAIFSRSEKPTEPNWTRHAEGRIRPGGRLPSSEDPTLLIQGFPAAIAPESLYSALKAAGLDYGPAFRVIQEAWSGDGEALCRLRLPAEAIIEGERYHFHPALLDGCLQALFAALAPPVAGDEALAGAGALAAYVPVAVERLVITSTAAGDQAWARVRVTERSPEQIRCDIEAFAADGAPLLFMQGCTLKGLHQRPRAMADRRPAGSWYHTEWEERPLEDDARIPIRPIPLELELELEPCLPNSDRNNKKRHGAEWRALDAAFNETLSAALSSGDETAPTPPERAQTLATGGKAPDWAALLRGYPKLFAEMDLLRRLSHLPAALKGETPALDALAAAGAGATLEHYDSGSSTWCVHNQTMAGVIGRLLAAFPEGRHLNLLELGARTGALAAELLHQELLPCTLEYHCCDPSSATLRLAEERLSAQPNIYCTPWADLGNTRYDLIVARDPALLTGEALTRVSGWIAAGGHLLASRRLDRPPAAERLEALLHATPAASHPTPEAWGDSLRQQGFELEQIRRDGVEWTLARAAATQHAIAPPAQKDKVQARTWWLLCDTDHPAAARIEGALENLGDSTTSLTPQGFLALPDLAAQLQGVAGLLYLAPLGAPAQDLAAMPEVGAAVYELLQILQALGDSDRLNAPPALSVITHGGFSAGRSPHGVQPTHAALAGMARVAMSELDRPACRVLDLSPEADAAEIAQLVRQLGADDGEEQVAFRHEARYIPRLAHHLEALPRTALVPDDPAYRCRLRSARAGSLDQLQVFREPRQTLAKDQVEIEVRAAGLNFRDVMKALGIYPTDAGDEHQLGDECAGLIQAVGPGVSGLRPGDRVIAIAPACFAGTAVTRAGLVLPLPEDWSFEEGATILIAYLTAYYALFRLGRLRPGERVLIHAGAGGVGLAAIHLAQQAGARVFATAGSDSKRTLLHDLGVEHVSNSRTLDFADEIRACTGGEGVDIVLNSLAGEAIHQGLSLLRPYGRFLEIGKRDIYEHGHLDLSPFRNALSYFAIDLARMMASGEAGEILDEMQGLFARGGVRPLPYRAYALTEAVEAFRYMAEARHVGKIVLSLPQAPLVARIPAEQIDFRCRSDRSYLVTGGLRGFGLATAEWLAERGARRLFLLSRSGQTDAESEAAIQRLRKRGVRIEALAVDVGTPAALDEALQAARSSAPIGGIVHAAAVYQDERLLQCSGEGLRRVLHAKAQGGWNLHQLTLNDPLEFFVLYSSISALIGNPGQAGYVAANAFLEGLAEARIAQNRPALAVGWDRITDTGYVARNQRLGEYMDRMGFGGLETAEALAALGHALGRLQQGHLVLTRTAWGEWLQKTRFLAASARFERLRSNEEDLFIDDEADSEWLVRLLELDSAQRHGYLLAQLRATLGRMLAVSAATLDPTKPLDELGLDSLTLVELISALESNLGLSLPSGLLASSGGRPMTLDALVDSLLALLQSDVSEQAAANEAAENEPEGAPDTHLAQLQKDAQLPDDIRFPDALPRPLMPEDPILLTGATGFLGCYLLRELLKRTTGTIYILVRSENEAAGLERIQQNLDHYGLEFPQSQTQRIRILPGDISQTRLGLPPATYQKIAREVTAVYHNAAAINHLLPYAQLRPINVEGVLHILRFAATGASKLLHFTSTVAVFAPEAETSEPRIIPEGALPEAPDALLGGYSETKWVAEKLVLHARERGLRTAIYRPGLVIGDACSGISSQHDILWRVVQSSVETGIAPDSQFPMPLTRVDFVASAIAELSLHAHSIDQIFHLVDTAETTLRQIIEQALPLGFAVRFVPLNQWTREMEQWREEGKTPNILPYLKLFPSDRRDNIISGAGIRFDAEQSQGLLSPETRALAPTMPQALARNLERLLQAPSKTPADRNRP